MIRHNQPEPELPHQLDNNASRARFSGKRLKWMVIMGFWVLVTLIAVSTQVGRMYTASCSAMTIVTEISLTDIPNYGAWALLTPLILLIGSRLSIERDNWKRRVAMLIALGIGVGFVHSCVQEAVHVLSTEPTPSHEQSLQHSLLFHIVPTLHFKFLIFSAILGMGYAFDYYQRYQERNARLGQLQKQLVQAKLDALKSQLHPHFLFNTLNTVSALVERDPTAARKMIARLSDLLRLTLDSKDKHEITLDHELSLLKHYLEIEQIRFQDRLKLRYEVAEDVKKALVPNMILQPLVENAIRHGISQRRAGGSIRISAGRENGFLTLSVEDDGPGLNGKNRTSKKMGVGLQNTQSRLTQLYGDNHKFELENIKERGLKVSLSLPFHRKPLTE